MPRLTLSRSLFVKGVVLALAVAAAAALSSVQSVEATSLAQRGATATPAPFATPTPMPPYPPPSGGGPGIPIEDTRLGGRVPSADVAAALANPDQIAGWGVPRNPNIPYNPYLNPYRTCLTLRNLAVPYHPTYNKLVYKAGCG